MTEEEGNEQLEEVREMWEMAAILDFLSVFKPVLGLNMDFNAGALERALVRSPGPGLLAGLHMVTHTAIFGDVLYGAWDTTKPA